MNEFIVWYSDDLNKDKFSKEFTLEQLISQDHLDYISDSKILINYKVTNINNGIGLKDINGKSIYADSSIVEFTIREDGIKLPVIGYFKFDAIFLRYYIRIIEDKGVENRYYLGLQVVPWDKYCDYIRDIKIIDTIQENKLGLIK